MSTIPRLLLGVTSAEPVTITITGSISTNPKLQVWKEQGEPDLIEYDAGAGRWQVALTPGAYVLRLDAAETATATMLSVAASAPVVFARHGEDPPVSDVAITRTWSATSTVVAGLASDPWPPPGSGSAAEPWLGRAVREHDADVPKP